MTLEALSHVLQMIGPAGVVLVVQLLALKRLHEQLSTVQEKRISDAQLAMTKLLEFFEQQAKERGLLTGAVDSNADAVRELRTLLEAILADRGVNPNPRLPPLSRRG